MTKFNWREIGVGLIVPVALITIWQLIASMGWVNPHVLPSPAAVVERWIAYLLPQVPYSEAPGSWLAWAVSGELIIDSIGSMFRVASGFLIGAALALPLGLMMGASPRVYALLNPLAQVLRPIPPIAYIPLAILWVRHVDGIYIRAARNLGASQRTLFLRVMLPAAVPYILSGVRIGIGTAFIVVIVSEMIAVNNGLGFRILEAREYFWSDKIMAGMISIGMLGLAIDIGVNKLNNHLLRWHRGLEH
jgi:NitT/TauT family transport system permease protein